MLPHVFKPVQSLLIHALKGQHFLKIALLSGYVSTNWVYKLKYKADMSDKIIN